MTSIELFNELNGKTVSRNYLEEILQQAKTENQTAVIYRISKILNDYPDIERFEMNIVQYPQGLAGAMHTGDYREALDDCGRLKKGWKFVKGNVVKVEKKQKKEKIFSFEFSKPITEKTIHQNYYSYDDFSNLSDSDLAKAYAYTMLALYLARNQKRYFDYFKKNPTYILFEVAKPEREKALVEELKKRNIIVRINIDFSEKKQVTSSKKQVTKTEKNTIKDKKPCKTCEKKITESDWIEFDKRVLENEKKFLTYLKAKNLDDYRKKKDILEIVVYKTNERTALEKKLELLQYTPVYDRDKKIQNEIKLLEKGIDDKNESIRLAIVEGAKIFGITESDFIEAVILYEENKKDFLNAISHIEDKKVGLAAPQPQLSTDDFKKMKVSELRKFTLEYYNTHLKGKKTAIKNHLKEVVFVSGAGRKLLQPIYKEKVALIEHLEELIKNSTYNNWGNRKKTDSPDVLGYLNFKSKITIDGEKRHVRISVILDRERKTKFKTFEVGTKPKKDASIRRVAVTNPKAGQIETSSRNKDTKKSVSNKKTDKNFGLSVPIPEVEISQNPMSSESAGPQVFVEEFTEPTQVQPEPVNPLPAVAHHRKGSLAKQLANAPTQTESYQIDRVDMAQFLGDMEIKNTDSLVITLTGGQGSGKTRFAFQFMNDLAQRYKVGHISIEEHPESRLYIEKVHQYLNPTALNNIEAHDVRSLSEIDKVIRENEVIVIDSFQKIKEIDSKFEVDKDLRKKYNGKLFLVIFQQTTDGKMRGGSKSQFDGDIILFTEKFANYQENYVYPDKNRYNPIPADHLRYNIFQQRLLPIETEEQTTENIVYDVIY
ncbi:hypothetical protein RCZ02_23710 [Capnocytophaga felis]|uniref:LPD3 domain-containing protein n=1 Tax=Capnocytophaga felis TaxID=2267611 RepID=UPI0012CBAA59|nr:hypothetical protein [Capnocytophaga felis]GET49540.1 hypothetical protein RCZ02_23710 [Capnocytophaga felis]